MVKYKMELKPIKTFGEANLPDDKKEMLKISLGFLEQMLNLHEKISRAEVQADMSIIIEAEDEISADIEQLHKGAILTKLA